MSCRAPGRATRAFWGIVTLLLLATTPTWATTGAGASQHQRASRDWSFYGYNQANTNANIREREITADNAEFLRREWETFNDDALNPEPPPTGFVLESVLGLEYPASVVGITASPLVADNTLYYIDQLGTVFARNARNGKITNSHRHWTTTLVDPDFDEAETPILPELFYTAPVLTRDHIWLVGSVYGRLHAIERRTGNEVDFDPSTPGLQPFPLITDLAFASVLGDSVVVESEGRTLFVAGINVILNDALVQGEEAGLQIAFDISDPANPTEVWRTFGIELDPATGLRFGSGVSIGAGLSVDPGLGYIFGGTGQNTTDPYPGYPDPDLAPPGFVDRSDSLYAIDYDTGEFVWTNQFHNGDVFNLNAPVGTGPNNPDGPRDADVLSPPVLYEVDSRPLAAVGSKGGIYRSVDRRTGETVWTRDISKRTGIGGVQAGGAFADGVLYVAGFEGIDDGFSDAQFGSATVTGKFPNAFFATFSGSFWADVEDVDIDDDPATGMRVKVYALDAETGASLWNVGGDDFVELLAGASLRHVSVANGVVFVSTSSGQLFALDAADGSILFTDQTPDLNEEFDLGIGKPHHASMNAGAVIARGRVYAAFGAQNNPSGGVYVYEVNQAPIARRDRATLRADQASVRIAPLVNDRDPNGDELRIAEVAGQVIVFDDGQPDLVSIPEGELLVYHPGDVGFDGIRPAVVFSRTSSTPTGLLEIPYVTADVAPGRVLNGHVLDEPNPTHRARSDSAALVIRVR